jgi:hypothetical protein
MVRVETRNFTGWNLESGYLRVRQPQAILT